MGKNYKSGIFKPKNKEKYRGNLENITYRSGWEYSFMTYLDGEPSILQWSSEEFFIPYKDPITSQYRRYFPDFWIKKITKDGNIELNVIEIKPYNQTIPPIPGQRKTRKLLEQIHNYAINTNKWEAAEKFCASRNWKFIKLTEKDILWPKKETKKNQKS